ncbi:MAG: DNA topoisomerase 3 [Syntrophobacteraceae bacterium]|nr:DNA topoisomerase 3 [Syntrophobacteraceae bacterium]
MITLVLTEKPSVARDFAKALGAGGRRDGYFEGKDYVITWAVGHLLELAEPRDYDSKWSRWRMDTLPILPEKLRYKPISKTEKQLRIVQKQLGRNDVGHVVIATDAGREGEVIARTILHSVGDFSFDRASRFWTSQALTPRVVKETLDQLRPSADFDRLWHAGQARQFADWLVGMNLSRAATLKFGSHRDVYSVGRVQTAVLALLVDRRRERERFVPKPYWLLRAVFENLRGTWSGSWFRKDETRLEDRDLAERLLALVSGQTGRVTSVKRENKRQAPPLLFSLTDLQREANAKFGFTAKQTLDIAQKLYEERKCLSYPRTDSRVLGSRNVDLAQQTIQKLSAAYPDLFSGHDPKLVSAGNKRVFNDARLTDHHALIPLAPIPEGASPQEKRIYDLVLKRFAAAFHPDYEYEATEIITEVSGETFRTRGSRPLKPGWKAVHGSESPSRTKAGNESDEVEEENLPPLEKGDEARVVEAQLDEKMTQPSPEYTEALLLKDMVNPSRFVTEEELQKIFKGEVGLGTQATRAQIIETLILRQYVTRARKSLAATDKGCFLIEQLRRFERARALASPEETARWEMELEKIALGMGRPETFLEAVRAFVEKGVREIKSTSPPLRTVHRTIGACPACGGEIIEGRKGFGCGNWRPKDGGCRFVIWKEISGRHIDAETVRRLLNGETVGPSIFRDTDGRDFSASLILERQGGEGETPASWAARLIRSETPPSGGDAVQGGSPQPSPLDVIGKCPRCGGRVIEGKKGYGCANWRPENGKCSFVIWKVVAGKTLTRKAVTDLLKKGETALLRGFKSRSGKKFSARLRLEGVDFRTVFVMGDPPESREE